MENDPLIGPQLGAYRIQNKLGKGGMAEVYKAYDPRLLRDVAIKVVLPEIAKQAGFRQRFEQEIRLSAQLEHHNIVRVYDVGQSGQLTYLVMQYVGGGTLRDKLRDGRPLEPRKAAQYALQMARALHHAHTRGIIHRDVKPQNMLVSASDPDELLLSDFGIAKLFDVSREDTIIPLTSGGIVKSQGLTNVGQMVGTAEYMAPEQINMQPVDARTDVYALGVVLFQMLTGQVPFQSRSALELLYQHLHTIPLSIRELNPTAPEALAQITAKALAKAPKARFQSAEEMAQALEAALSFAAADRSAPSSGTYSLVYPSQQKEVAPVGDKCPHCGVVIDPNSSFCPNCGYYLHSKISPYEQTQFSMEPPSVQGLPLSDVPMAQEPKVPIKGSEAFSTNTCPFCGAGRRPKDNFCLNCGNRLLPATPSFQQAPSMMGDATIPGSDYWAAPIGMEMGAGPPTIKATLDKIENPACFVVRDDKGDVLQEYRLEKFETVIGRAPTSDIVLSKGTLASRLHAVVRYENSNYVISDKRSANGTFVNGEQLEELTPRILKDGDHVGIGEHELIFRIAMSTGVEDLPTIAISPDTAAQELAYRTSEDEFVTGAVGDQPLSEQMDAGTIGTRFMHTVEDQFGTAAAVPMNPPEELAPVDDLKSIALDATASSHPPPSPYSTFALDQTIAQLLEEGELHYKAKRYEDALAAFKRVIQMDPRNARAYGYKGNVLGKRGKYKDALAAYDAALAIDPNHASIWSAKGDVLSKLRRYEGALVAYDGALALNTENARTWTAKGNVFSNLKRYEEALDAYNNALELNTGDAMIWTAEGNVLFKLERYEEALVAYDHALKITLKKAFIWDAKGEVLYKLKRYEEALEAHNRALALDPYNASISSKCDRLRDLIKHLKEKLAETQVKEKLAEAQAASQANTRVFNAKDISVNQLGTQQTLHDTPKRQETSELPIQPEDGTKIFERFDVFLSHSHLDAKWVEKNLAMRLDNHGFRVWLDKWILVPGEPWQPALARGIEQAHCCVVCIGEQASSGWFQQVIQRAKNRQAHDSSFRVIPVLLPNAKEINIDDFLELNALVDFRNSDFARAFHVLVCGVKGIPPGPPPSERATSTRTSTTAEEMLQELERLSQSNLITDPVKEEYMRLTMEKVWFAEWTLRLKESTNG